MTAVTRSAWPRYQAPLLRETLVTVQFLLDPRTLGRGALLGALIALYGVGLFLSLPTIRPEVSALTASWWFLGFLDMVLTGGAFGRGAVLSLGAIPSLLLVGLASPVQRRRPRRLFRQVAVCLGLAGLATILFLVRGIIDRSARATLITWGGLALGGIVARFIDTYLSRHGGPETLHLNVLVLLGSHALAVAREVHASSLSADVFVAGAAALAIVLAGFRAARRRIYMALENIKSESSRRTTMLQMPALDRALVDIIGITSLLLFLTLGGVASLLGGWRQISEANFPFFTAISAVVLVMVGALVPLMQQTLRLQDPERYAHAMLNGFWIVPGVPAGPPTEALLRAKMRVGLRWVLATLVVGQVALFAIQFYAFGRRPGLLLFPYGPLIFSALLAIAVDSLSASAFRIGLKLSQYRQRVRGQSRVLLQTHRLSPPGRVRDIDPLSLDPLSMQEERLHERMTELMEWSRLARTLQPARGTARRPLRRGMAFLRNMVAAFISGVVLAFLGGGLYVLLAPQATAIWEVVIPLFLGGMFSPTLVSAWLGHR